MTEDFSNIPSFSLDDLEAVRESLGITETPGTDTPTTYTTPIRRKRGRPRKSPLPTAESIAEEPVSIVPPAKLTRTEQKELAERLKNILFGASGIPAGLFDRPYIQMTDQEARNIADPTASYLERVSETNPIARQIIDNYDLAAIAIGLIAYFMRVVGDRREEVRTRPTPIRQGTSKATALDRISQHQTASSTDQNQADGSEQSDGFSGQFVAPIPIVPQV